jgi:hypothetical protein
VPQTRPVPAKQGPAPDASTHRNLFSAPQAAYPPQALTGRYLTDQDIDGKERVRGTMNDRLDAICARIWLFTDIHGDYAAEKLDKTKQRITDFARGARQHNFSFHNMNGKGRAAHIGTAQPAAMNLISVAVDKDMPELGRTYQRLLSATAHSGVHGLARMLTPLSPYEGRPGEALAAVTIDPRTRSHSIPRPCSSSRDCRTRSRHRMTAGITPRNTRR